MRRAESRRRQSGPFPEDRYRDRRRQRRSPPVAAPRSSRFVEHRLRSRRSSPRHAVRQRSCLTGVAVRALAARRDPRLSAPGAAARGNLARLRGPATAGDLHSPPGEAVETGSSHSMRKRFRQPLPRDRASNRSDLGPIFYGDHALACLGDLCDAGSENRYEQANTQDARVDHACQKRTTRPGAYGFAIQTDVVPDPSGRRSSATATCDRPVSKATVRVNGGTSFAMCLAPLADPDRRQRLPGR